MEKNKQNQNIVAIGVGFFMIAGIAILTFLMNGDKKDEKNGQSEKIISEKNANLASISPEALLKKISLNKTVKIIDIRSADDFGNEHVLNAFNYLPEAIQAEASTFDQSAEYVIIDDLGLTPKALTIIQYLSEKGFKNVAYLEGGFVGWKEDRKSTR